MRSKAPLFLAGLAQIAPGLTVRACAVLALLADAPEGRMRHKAIAAWTEIPPPALSRLLDTLEAQELVTRHRHSATHLDVEILPKGKALAVNIGVLMAGEGALPPTPSAQGTVDA